MSEKELENTYSPYEEMVAYETLWGISGITQKKLAELFNKNDTLPSHLLSMIPIENNLFEPELQNKVESLLIHKIGSFSIMINKSYQYPIRLREAKYPLELFYYKGDIGLLDSPCISVVGSRDCSEAGRKRTKRLVSMLVKEGYTIVSGLAKGIDTAAHKTALNKNGITIGVIGTPIDQYYPKENKGLQDIIAEKHLLISQVPFYRYNKENFNNKKIYFPQRNVTMAAISEATVIIEASTTSGTHKQAKACINQGRSLFILDSNFQNPAIKWPYTYMEQGAIRVKEFEDIIETLNRRKRGKPNIELDKD